MGKVLTSAGQARRTFKTKLIQVNSDTPFFKSFKIFTSLDMNPKGIPDYRPIKSQTFFTITNLIDFGNTEI